MIAEGLEPSLLDTVVGGGDEVGEHGQNVVM